MDYNDLYDMIAVDCQKSEKGMADKINLIPHQAEYYKLPEDISLEYEKHPLLQSYFVSAAGYFPEAKGHLLKRDPIGESVLIYCTKGRGYYQIEEKIFNVEAGALLCCWHDRPHFYWADKSDPWTIHWVHCRGVDVLNFLKHLGFSGDQPLLSLGVLPNVMRGFYEIVEHFRMGFYKENHFLLSGMLHEVLATIVMSISEGGGQEKEDRFAAILKFMDKNVHQVVSIETFAMHSHLSPGYFFRKFKKKYGFTPLEYFNRLKVQKACNELSVTDKSIKEISNDFGFEDPLYFSRLFSRVMSMSPKAYRAKESQR